jgi:hypothetical protein
MISNKKAAVLVDERHVLDEDAFVEIVVWGVPREVRGSAHRYKYRLALVVAGECVLRYDNEAGKGDHRHYGGKERSYAFTGPDELIAAFEADIARWNREKSNP